MTTLKPKDLVILLSQPRGFCARVVDITNQKALICLLDSANKGWWVDISDLIPTGKSGLDLVSQYKPDLTAGLTEERTFPDFSIVRTRKTKTKAKKEPKPLTAGQKEFIGKLLKQRLAELAKKGD